MVFIKLDKTCCVFEIFLRSKLRAADRESKVGILYLVWPYSGFIHWQPPASSHGAITYIHATIWPTFPTSIILDCVFKAQIFYKHQHPTSIFNFIQAERNKCFWRVLIWLYDASSFLIYWKNRNIFLVATQPRQYSFHWECKIQQLEQNLERSFLKAS